VNPPVLLAASFLERNSWVPGVVVAVVLFIIGTGISFYWRRGDKESKHLDYQILSDTPIITSRDKPQILKVIYGATEVTNPFITEVRFKNTGKQVIDADDFLGPMTILRRSAKVLDFNDVGQSEANLVDFMETSLDAPGENKPVVVTPNTLNPGDWFTVQVIYDSRKRESVTVTGRIKGQTRPPQEYQDREGLTSSARSKFLIGAQSLLVVAIILLSITPGGHPSSNTNSPIRWALIILTLFANVLIVIVVWDESNRMLRAFQTWLASKRKRKSSR
jgi:hypothetical protein